MFTANVLDSTQHISQLNFKWQLNRHSPYQYHVAQKFATAAFIDAIKSYWILRMKFEEKNTFNGHVHSSKLHQIWLCGSIRLWYSIIYEQTVQINKNNFAKCSNGISFSSVWFRLFNILAICGLFLLSGLHIKLILTSSLAEVDVALSLIYIYSKINIETKTQMFTLNL